MMAERQKAMDGRWLVCEECASMFAFDREVARRFTAEGSRPPGCGPASSGVGIAAAYAWTKLYGCWPETIQVRAEAPPETGTPCDFCARRTYPDEEVALVKEPAVQLFELDGLRRRGAASNQVGNEAAWLACSLCVARSIRLQKEKGSNMA